MKQDQRAIEEDGKGERKKEWKREESEGEKERREIERVKEKKKEEERGDFVLLRLSTSLIHSSIRTELFSSSLFSLLVCWQEREREKEREAGKRCYSLSWIMDPEDEGEREREG